MVVATEGHKTVKENIINIFGAKQISTLIDVDIINPDKDILNEYGVNLEPDEELPFTFEFLISSVVHGSGRSVTDRQFYFINSRPCEPSRLMKLVNEVYKQYNVGQYPFVFMNIITKSSLVDVNVTPDKRQIFLENEKILLATIKASLLNSFKSFPSTFKMQNLDISNIIAEKNLERGIKRSLSDGIVKKGGILERFKKRSKTEENAGTSGFTSVEINSSFEIPDAIKEECDKKLNMLIDTACKLLPEEHSENVVDIVAITNENNFEDDTDICLDQPPQDSIQKSVSLNITMDDIRAVLRKTKEQKSIENIKIRFRSEIKPESNKSAEEELEKQIAKNDFKEMDIIGQFNLGFVITKLHNDLFIVDQHATDEKYNFEQLQLSTVIDSQILVK